MLALGSRLSQSTTAWNYSILNPAAKIIQVDINPNRIGLTKKVTIGIVADAKKVAESILAKLSANAGNTDREERKNLISTTKSRWAQELSSMDHEDDDPGTTWNQRARDAKPDWMSPRMAWRAIQAALPKEAIISSDIGNNCAIGNAYPTFEAPRKVAARDAFFINDRFRSVTVSPDGQRLLMIRRDEGSVPNRLNVIVNWPGAAR